MRYIAASVFLFLLSVCALAETTVGAFKEVQVGDYAHLVILDDKGEEHSFWLGAGPGLESLVMGPESYEGSRLKVEWRRVERDIPEAGGPMEIEEAFAVTRL